MASADGWIAHVMSLRGSRPTYAATGEEDVLAGFQRLHRHRLPLRSRIERTLGSEQLEAADVDSRQQEERVAAVHPHQGRRDKVHRDVRRPGAHGFRRLIPASPARTRRP